MIFAFIGNSVEGYYLNNGHGKSTWKQAPEGLATALRSLSSSEVLDAAGSMNGKYFLRTTRGNWTNGLASGLVSKDIRIISWGPSGEYFTKSSAGQSNWSNAIPDGLRNKINEVGAYNVISISIGRDNRWAVMWKAGMITKWAWSVGLPKRLADQLRDAKKVKSIVLSPWDSNNYWLEYGDEKIIYHLPVSWKPDVDRIINSS